MVGTKWIGFPAVATGAVAQSVDGGVTFRASSAAYTPITLTALSCPTQLGLRRGGRGHRGPAHPGPPKRRPHRRPEPHGLTASQRGAVRRP